MPDGSVSGGITRWERDGGILSGAALSVMISAFVFSPKYAFPSYLIGFLFWIGITLGCLPLLMIHHLTGGRWGLPLRPFFRAGLATLPLMALLVVPIFLGLRYLYPWAGLPTAEDAKEVLRVRAIYLNVPAVIIRAMVSYAVWLGLTWLLLWQPLPDEARPAKLRARLQLTSGLGLVVFTVVTSFALIDWLMAIEPTWYSSIFPAIVLNGQVLCSLALALLLSLHRFGASRPDDEQLNHISSLLFAFVLMWAYLSVSQLIIIYAGNLPHEISWYLRRTRGSWFWVAMILALFQFALPFVLLLFRGIKKSPRMLTAIAALQLVVQVVATFWYTAPAYRHALRLTWTDPVAFIAIGVAWVVAFGRQVRREPRRLANPS
ncbi:MAG: hypothetical protein JO069_12200 [Verrucomicrobia bacterium]|nr:hypothetical protein [Verrucomicrobiota bacterium]